MDMAGTDLGFIERQRRAVAEAGEKAIEYRDRVESLLGGLSTTEDLHISEEHKQKLGRKGSGSLFSSLLHRKPALNEAEQELSPAEAGRMEEAAGGDPGGNALLMAVKKAADPTLDTEGRLKVFDSMIWELRVHDEIEVLAAVRDTAAMNATGVTEKVDRIRDFEAGYFGGFPELNPMQDNCARKVREKYEGLRTAQKEKDLKNVGRLEGEFAKLYAGFDREKIRYSDTCVTLMELLGRDCGGKDPAVEAGLQPMFDEKYTPAGLAESLGMSMKKAYDRFRKWEHIAAKVKGQRGEQPLDPKTEESLKLLLGRDITVEDDPILQARKARGILVSPFAPYDARLNAVEEAENIMRDRFLEAYCRVAVYQLKLYRDKSFGGKRHTERQNYVQISA